MSEQEKPGHLDALLDSLLATYSDAEPRHGMETRLLVTLRAESPCSNRSERWAWQWLLAGAAAVAVTAVVVFAVYWSQIPATPQPPKIEIAGPPPLPSVPAIPAPHESGHRLRSWRAPRPDTAASVTAQGVRQEIFPSPTPLSEQERLLMRYLADTPRREIAAQSHKDEPMYGAGSLEPQGQHFNGTEEQKFTDEDVKEKL